MELAANVFNALMGLGMAVLGIFMLCVGVSARLNALQGPFP